MAVKDLVAVAGVPSRSGGAWYADATPERRDAVAVAALRSVGAVLVGTAAMHELAFGVTGVNALGTPANPVDPARIPGGSGSGSPVAVAERSADVSLGTDTGGSVRIPSALCGVVDFKPSFGAYPLDGVLSLAPTLDHFGVHARTVREVAAVHAVLTGSAGVARWTGTPPVRPGAPRLGVAAVQQAECEPVVAGAQAFAALGDAGVTLGGVELPGTRTVLTVSTPILLAEAAIVYAVVLRRGLDQIGPDVAERLMEGARTPSATHAKATAERLAQHKRVSCLLDGVDAVIDPTVPITAATFDEARGEPELGRRLVPFTRLANLTGHPAVTIPLPGCDLPVGLQVLAATDEAALDVASWCEHVLGSEP